MNIIFAGTPEFACPSLQALLTSQHTVIAVYTQPDRPAGRGRRLQASPVKQLALAHQIPIEQPTTLRDQDTQATLANYQADVMIVVAYGLILPSAVLTSPKHGCLNIHASLLPRWRGAAPIQRAILAGDNQTGVTIMQMDEGLDTGAMLAKATYDIAPGITSAMLHDQLAQLGAQTLLPVLDTLATGVTLESQTQDHSQACYADKLTKAEAVIDWQQSAQQIDRAIRAFNPWPVAQSSLSGIAVRIWLAHVVCEHTTTALPGTIVYVDRDSVYVATGDGVLSIDIIQLPGKQALPVKDVLNAHAALFALNQQFDTLTQ